MIDREKAESQLIVRQHLDEMVRIDMAARMGGYTVESSGSILSYAQIFLFELTKGRLPV